MEQTEQDKRDTEALARLYRSMTNQTPSKAAVSKIEDLRSYYKAAGAHLIQNVAESRERSLAITALEESLMWAVKGVILKDRPEAG